MALEEEKTMKRVNSYPEYMLGLEDEDNMLLDSTEYNIGSHMGISGILHIILNKNENFYCEDKYFIWKRHHRLLIFTATADLKFIVSK